MRVKNLLLFVLLLSSRWCYASPAAQAQEPSTLQRLSQEIHAQLDSLRRQSENLTQQLLQAENDLEQSSRQVEELQRELRVLNTCLDNTNRKLAEYSTKLNEYETKLKRRGRLVAAGVMLIILFVLTRLVLAFLMIKCNIRIPYWLNLIL